jgi:hypothetical protein
MLKRIVNFIGIALVAVAMGGCKDIASIAFEPYPDVSVVATVRRLSYHNFEIYGPTTFIHFRYVVTLRSDIPLYFKVENVALNVNGRRNRGTYYDTVASIVPQWRFLKKGKTVIEAYASFPGTIKGLSLPDVEFVDLGFSRDIERNFN